jgi:hypothetical protein
MPWTSKAVVRVLWDGSIRRGIVNDPGAEASEIRLTIAWDMMSAMG